MCSKCRTTFICIFLKFLLLEKKKSKQWHNLTPAFWKLQNKIYICIGEKWLGKKVWWENFSVITSEKIANSDDDKFDL